MACSSTLTVRERKLCDAGSWYLSPDFAFNSGWVEGPANELYAGIKIYEISNRVPGLKHFIYSSIPYTSNGS